MYRKAILAAFAILVAASAIYALIDKKQVTTSSDKAYEAYLKGIEYSNKLYTMEAKQEFENAVKLDPQFAMAYARLAPIYKDLGRNDEYEHAKAKALEFIDKVKDLERIEINLLIARTEQRMNDVEAYANELLKKYPDNLDGHAFKSTQYWIRGEVDKGIDENLKVLEIDPEYALAYNMLGYLYYQKGEYDKALEYIDKYSTLAVDQANPHDSNGEILLWLGRYDEALRQFQIADSIKPDLDFVVDHLGKAYAAKGMYRDAMGAYLKAKELALGEGRRAEFTFDISDMYYFSDRPDEALEVLKDMEDKRSENLGLHLRLGLIYANTGRLDDALVELGIVKSISAKRSDDSQLQDDKNNIVYNDQNILEAEIAAARGDYDSAIALYSAMIPKIRLPNKILVYTLLGKIYTRAGKADSAVAVITEALKDNPNNARALAALAKAYNALGREDAAQEALSRLMVVYKDADEDYPPYMQAAAELKKLEKAAL